MIIPYAIETLEQEKPIANWIIIGACGAINGITGIVLAVYPTNRVRLIWFAIIRAGTTVARAWIIITVWLLFDIIWLIIGAEGVAYWAHIGGLAAGVVIGLLCLQKGWILTTDADNKTLLEIIKGTK